MPYTTHGHWYGDGEPTRPGPRLVAKCFGLGGCATCRADAGLPPLPEPEPTPKKITVYASIGNSDDKLTQQEWSGYARRFVNAVQSWGQPVHGVWYSAPDAPYQNACVCFEIVRRDVGYLRDILASLAVAYGQDSIAWAVADTTFITPDGTAP